MELDPINLATLAGQGAPEIVLTPSYQCGVANATFLFFVFVCGGGCWRSNFKLAQQALPTEPPHLHPLLFLCQLIRYLSFGLHLS